MASGEDYMPFIVGACIASHWFLDAVVHRPDLPLALGGAHRFRPVEFPSRHPGG